MASQELNLPALQLRGEKLYKTQMWDEALPVLQEYVERCPADARMRLRLAAMNVEIQERPRYALRVLAKMDSESLDQRLRRWRSKIEARARQMIDDGVLELDLGS